MSWKDNAIMFWSDLNGDFQKVTDHGRAPLSESYEVIERKSRMADGTLRKYVVAKKRNWSTSWSTLPSRNDTVGMRTVDSGWAGRQMEDYYNAQDGDFLMILRNGSALNMEPPVITPDMTFPFEDDNFYIARVMFAEFSKDVIKRGPTDLWEASLTLEEV